MPCEHECRSQVILMACLSSIEHSHSQLQAHAIWNWSLPCRLCSAIAQKPVMALPGSLRTHRAAEDFVLTLPDALNLSPTALSVYDVTCRQGMAGDRQVQLASGSLSFSHEMCNELHEFKAQVPCFHTNMLSRVAYPTATVDHSHGRTCCIYSTMGKDKGASF